jgi:hypothetical protein
MTQVFTYDYGFPSPQPPATIRTTIHDSVTVLSASQPGLPPGAQDVNVRERDTTPLQATQTVTDAFVSPPEAELLLYGSKSKFEAPQGGQSSTTVTAYANPQILSKSAGHWTNSPEATIDEKYSDGHYQDRTIAANGTYNEKGTTLALNGKVAPIEILEKASGAGSYTGPFLGCPPHTSFTFTAAPSIDLQLISSPPVGGCEMSKTPIPDWYPAGTTFYTEHDSVKANATMPVQCGSHAGKGARLTERKLLKLDTVIGYYEDTDISVFSSSNAVPLCFVLGDEISNYYDWQGDQIAFFAFTPNGHPVSTIRTDEALELVGGAASSAGAATVARASVEAGVQTHFMDGVNAERVKLRDAMVRRFTNVSSRIGGVR